MDLHKRRGLLSPISDSSFYSTVTAAAQDVSTTLVPGRIYKFTTTTGCLIRQNSSGADASLGAGSMIVAPGDEVYIEGSQGTTLSVIRTAADGHCTLARVQFLNSDG